MLVSLKPEFQSQYGNYTTDACVSAQLVGILNYSLRAEDNCNNSAKVLIQAQVKKKRKKLFQFNKRNFLIAGVF